MSYRIVAVFLTMLLVCGAVEAKPNLADWNNVLKLSAGSKVVVSTRKGEVFEGEVRQVDNDMMMLLVRISQSSRQAVEIRREDVTQVRKPKSRLLSTALGAAIGLAVGIGIGAGVDARSSGEDPGLGKVIFGSLGTLGGLAVGSALPMKGKKIYVAP